jgi:hypothetical protein
MNDLVAAQEARDNQILEDLIDERLEVLLSHADVSPAARAQLRKLLAFYAKKPHPFRACVRDNMKRFGPGRTERVCATVKDMIRGTHKWRSTERKAVAASPQVTEEIEQILLSVPDEALDQIVMEVQ